MNNLDFDKLKKGGIKKLTEDKPQKKYLSIATNVDVIDEFKNIKNSLIVATGNYRLSDSEVLQKLMDYYRSKKDFQYIERPDEIKQKEKEWSKKIKKGINDKK